MDHQLATIMALSKVAEKRARGVHADFEKAAFPGLNVAPFGGGLNFRIFFSKSSRQATGVSISACKILEWEDATLALEIALIGPENDEIVVIYDEDLDYPDVRVFQDEREVIHEVFRLQDILATGNENTTCAQGNTASDQPAPIDR